MECSVCQVRSSVGYCKECQRVLCEVCGIPCDRCHKLLCRVHRQRTPGGRNLCEECMAHREARKTRRAEEAKQEAQPHSFQALLEEFDDELIPGEHSKPAAPPEEKIEDYRPDWAGEAPPEPPPKQVKPKSFEDELNARVLTGSAAQTRPPWINAAIVGVFSCLMAFFARQNTPFRAVLQPWLSYGIMLVALGALVLGVAGYRQQTLPMRERRMCGIGVLLALIAAVLAWRAR